MAAIEIGLLSRQCLSKYIDARDRMRREIFARETAHNNSQNTIDWHFGTKDVNAYRSAVIILP